MEKSIEQRCDSDVPAEETKKSEDFGIKVEDSDGRRTLSGGQQAMEAVSRKPTDEKPLLVEKAQSMVELQPKPKENPFEYITREELERLFEGHAVPETHSLRFLQQLQVLGGW